MQDPYNKSLSACVLCDKVYTNKKSLRVHVISAHQIDYKKGYLEVFGDPEANNPKVYSIIIICNKSNMY